MRCAGPMSRCSMSASRRNHSPRGSTGCTPGSCTSHRSSVGCSPTVSWASARPWSWAARSWPSAKQKMTREEWLRVGVIVIACAIVASFWAVYEQQGNTLQLWADQNTRWVFFGLTIPSTWYQAFNPFMIFLFTPLLTSLWGWQRARNQEPTSLTKMAMGCVLLGLGFIIMIAAANGLASADAKRSILWLVGSPVLYTFGELYLSPLGLSFVTKVASVRMVSMMMGVWFLANFIGTYLAGFRGMF